MFPINLQLKHFNISGIYFMHKKDFEYIFSAGSVEIWNWHPLVAKTLGINKLNTIIGNRGFVAIMCV